MSQRAPHIIGNSDRGKPKITVCISNKYYVVLPYHIMS